MATTQIKPSSTTAASAGTGWPKRNVNNYDNRLPQSPASLNINRPINL